MENIQNHETQAWAKTVGVEPSPTSELPIYWVNSSCRTTITVILNVVIFYHVLKSHSSKPKQRHLQIKLYDVCSCSKCCIKGMGGQEGYG